MGVELLFAPLALIRKARPILWVAMFVVQLGFLCLLNFADLTTPMLLFHLLPFDPKWIPAKQSGARVWILYDGCCWLCHRVVRFALAEDRSGKFMFSPQQGAAFRQAVSEEVRAKLPDSFIVIDQSGRLLLRSDAVIEIGTHLGGLWRILAATLASFPKPLRDGGYRFVAWIRSYLYAKPADNCPMVPDPLRARFIEWSGVSCSVSKGKLPGPARLRVAASVRPTGFGSGIMKHEPRSICPVPGTDALTGAKGNSCDRAIVAARPGGATELLRCTIRPPVAAPADFVEWVLRQVFDGVGLRLPCSLCGPKIVARFRM